MFFNMLYMLYVSIYIYDMFCMFTFIYTYFICFYIFYIIMFLFYYEKGYGVVFACNVLLF